MWRGRTATAVAPFDGQSDRPTPGDRTGEGNDAELSTVRGQVERPAGFEFAEVFKVEATTMATRTTLGSQRV